MARNKSILIRISDEEIEKIRSNAAKAQMSISKYLRTAALENKIKVYDMAAVNELALQFHKIGVNINQITAMVNQTGIVYKNDLENLFKETSAMKKQMDSFLYKFEKDNIENGD